MGSAAVERGVLGELRERDPGDGIRMGARAWRARNQPPVESEGQVVGRIAGDLEGDQLGRPLHHAHERADVGHGFQVDLGEVTWAGWRRRRSSA